MNDPDPAVLRLAALIESSDDAIISQALDGTIETWNGGAERMFGYPVGEAVGKPGERRRLPASRLDTRGRRLRPVMKPGVALPEMSQQRECLIPTALRLGSLRLFDERHEPPRKTGERPPGKGPHVCRC